jgi:Uma2 family endonuclease
MSQAVLQVEEPHSTQFSGKAVLRMPNDFKLSDDAFFELCQVNHELRIERTATGEIIIMPPTGWETGNRNAEITGQLRNWSKQNSSGEAADSSTGFKLPSGADRSPDASWVRRERLAQLTAEQKRKFLPLCPDFVVELVSPTDKLEDGKAKMEEYLANGAQLGWLIDPAERRVYVYRPDRAIEVLENPDSVAGDPELPGFVLQLAEIWEPNI